MLSITKKSVFITGANRGLGKGFIQFFLNLNYQVFAGTRSDIDYGLDLQKNPNLILVKLDVTDDKAIELAFKKVSSHTDHLDFLINNAGTNKDSVTNNHKELVCNLLSLDRKLLLKMFDINAISPIMILSQFLPLLKSSPCFVINISSARSSYKDENISTSGNYGYRSSKAALNLMTFCSLFDIPKNVKTFAVHPGNVKTDMNPTGIDLPHIQAEKIINITNDWKEEFNGKFLRYDGTVYPI